MTAHIIYGTDFKRSNPKSDRAFWKGPDSLELAALEFSIVNQIFPSVDTAPAEYCCADEKDPA